MSIICLNMVRLVAEICMHLPPVPVSIELDNSNMTLMRKCLSYKQANQCQQYCKGSVVLGFVHFSLNYFINFLLNTKTYIHTPNVSKVILSFLILIMRLIRNCFKSGKFWVQNYQIADGSMEAVLLFWPPPLPNVFG